jgi:ELWxxDGT repeat protein
MVKNIRPGSEGSGLYAAAKLGGTLYFTANDGTHGYELWRTDGTKSGTALVADLYPGKKDSLPDDITRSGKTVLFSAWEPSVGRELWSIPPG